VVAALLVILAGAVLLAAMLGPYPARPGEIISAILRPGEQTPIETGLFQMPGDRAWSSAPAVVVLWLSARRSAKRQMHLHFPRLRRSCQRLAQTGGRDARWCVTPPPSRITAPPPPQAQGCPGNDSM
jgi:hypothetical protein